MYNKNLKAYKNNSLQADMSVADPHRVIQLMLQGLQERLAQTKGQLIAKIMKLSLLLFLKLWL